MTHIIYYDMRLEWYTVTMEGLKRTFMQTSGSTILFLSLVLLFSCISYSSAFLIVKPWNGVTSSSQTTIRSKGGGFSYVKLSSSSSTNDEIKKLTHADIQWKLEPPEDMSLFDRMKIKAAAKAIHTECLLKGAPVPPILCPKGGKATLAAYINGTYVRILNKLQLTFNIGCTHTHIYIYIYWQNCYQN